MPKRGAKTWQHPPDALTSGHILYTVKFLGECVVDQPKGTEIVKDAIRKMKFNKHIKRAEGQKPPKVELTISVDAVSILDPKARLILHQYPLHRISYCADDKSDKRMFTFIAKEANGNKHYCYVFDSEKCAEEITLTIGQAFDLAYKRFLENCSSEGDLKKSYLNLQKKVQSLTFENDALRKRIAELEQMKDRSDVEEYKKNNQISDLRSVSLTLNESSTDDDTPNNSTQSQPTATVGRRLEGLVFNTDRRRGSTPAETNGTSHSRLNSLTSPTQQNSPTPVLSPPPSNTRAHRANGARSSSFTSVTPTTPNVATNPFLSMGSPTGAVDPFGMEAFAPTITPDKTEQELIDIRAGFSRGLSFGTDDFNLEDLDPLSHRL